MLTLTVPICAKCSSPIMAPQNGFIVSGLIMPAQLDAPAIIQTTDDTDAARTNGGRIRVRPMAFCRSCFCSALGIRETVTR